MKLFLTENLSKNRLTNHSTSQLGATFCLILPNQTVGFSEFEITGGSWQWPTISYNKIKRNINE